MKTSKLVDYQQTSCELEMVAVALNLLDYKAQWWVGLENVAESQKDVHWGLH